MKGNEIIVSDTPRGVRHEGTIYGTPKPGTCMQIKAATEPVNGRFTWEVYDRISDGIRALVAVLLPNDNEGMIATTAYVSGTRGFIYCPAPGEELNMLIGDISGTGGSSDFAIGDRLMIDDGTGKLVDALGNVESVPFILLETITDLTADYLAWCMYTGY